MTSVHVDCFCINVDKEGKYSQRYKWRKVVIISPSPPRQAEAVFVEERDEDVPGDEWERVARLCDFNPKNNKNTKDISRMRSIFLHLKQTPLVRD